MTKQDDIKALHAHEESCVEFAEMVARMVRNREMENGYDETDHEALDGLIVKAREITGIDPDYPVMWDPEVGHCECGICECSVTPEDQYYSTPCGSFCDECIHEHAKECGVCAKEFDLETGEEDEEDDDE